jgi:hypothetical protein
MVRGAPFRRLSCLTTQGPTELELGRVATPRLLLPGVLQRADVRQLVVELRALGPRRPARPMTDPLVDGEGELVAVLAHGTFAQSDVDVVDHDVELAMACRDLVSPGLFRGLLAGRAAAGVGPLLVDERVELRLQ